MKIVAFGAHPDDLEPQIGGSVAKFVRNGGSATLVTCTTTTIGAQSSLTRQQEGERAAKILGSEFICMGIEEEELSYNRYLINEIEQIIQSVDPDIVYTVSGKDSHQDHQSVYKSVKTAARKNTFSLIALAQVLPGGISDHKVNYFNDISDVIDLKKEAMFQYESQIEKYGEEWLDAIIARDKTWGFNIGTQFAEANFIEKWVS